jgi:hypothetical protein
MLPEKLVIVDYCGTLSPEAPHFGRPENLHRALEESGLATLGVSTPELFWSDIVNPTWVEGSTTAIGYARVMADRIASLYLAPDAPAGEIEAATSRFVAVYLDASRIDPCWRPALIRLSKHPATITVVATDHYAEATGKITGYLDSWGIPTTKSGTGEAPFSSLQRSEESHGRKMSGARRDRSFQRSPRFFVANSADLGVWKEDRRFWVILKSQLPLASVRRILMIDDFGFNEAPGDSYGERAKVLARREKTVTNLAETFRAALEVVPFDLPGEDWGNEEAAAKLIEKTAAHIDAFLESRQ